MGHRHIVPVSFPHTIRLDKFNMREEIPHIEFTCLECGDIHARDSYVPEVRNKLRTLQICFLCNFWRDQYAKYIQESTNPKSRMTIINGYWYSPGDGGPGGSFLGMAGRKFNIEYIRGPHTGKRITTYDLWAGGQFPKQYRALVEDNARFLGAEKAQVGDTTCWNHTQDSPWNVPYMKPRYLFKD